MPTLKFTDFETPADVVPNNDYVVGYNKINGVDREAKWNLYKLASEVLPNAGLGTRNHQVRKLAKVNFEGSYSMAAITRREEIVCWGSNIQANPAPANAARSLVLDNQYTKFGAGYTSVDKAPAWQPIVIPFMSGNPGDVNQDILDLQLLGLTVVDLIWDEWSAMARLSDGSVWLKSIIGRYENVGHNQADMPVSGYFAACFYKIGNWDLSSGETMNAKWIDSFPMFTPIVGGLWMVIDQNNDLHLWGETTTGPAAPGYSVWPGDAAKRNSATPVNITRSSNNPDLVGKVRYAQMQGDPQFCNHSIQVITTENKLYSIGYNAKGNLGLGNLLNQSTWVQSQYKVNAGATPVPVDNAYKFVTAKYEFHITGYLSTISQVNGGNNLFLCGTNENAGELMSTASPTPSAANAYYASPLASPDGDPFEQAFINNAFTCVVRTRYGKVYSAGKNVSGEAGRGVFDINNTSASLALGATFSRVTYKVPGTTSSTQFGNTGALSAVDMSFCSSSQIANATALKVKTPPMTGWPNGKYQLYIAGAYTFTSQFNSFVTRDSVFRLFPLKESINEIHVGGTIFENNHFIIHTETGRTYGVGFGPNGLIADATHRVQVQGVSYYPVTSYQTYSGTTVSYNWARSWLWGRYGRVATISSYSYTRSYTNYVPFYYNYTVDQTVAWSPQPTILF